MSGRRPKSVREAPEERPGGVRRAIGGRPGGVRGAPGSCPEGVQIVFQRRSRQSRARTFNTVAIPCGVVGLFRSGLADFHLALEMSVAVRFRRQARWIPTSLQTPPCLCIKLNTATPVHRPRLNNRLRSFHSCQQLYSFVTVHKPPRLCATRGFPNVPQRAR